MSNKLTMEAWAIKSLSLSINKEWELIEAHTAECVAEAVEEVKKTHFEIGEEVEVKSSTHYGSLSWLKARIGPLVPYIGTSLVVPEYKKPYDLEVRRIVKTRQMTDEEIRLSIYRKTGLDWGGPYLGALSRPTLEAMAKDLNIALEVSDE